MMTFCRISRDQQRSVSYVHSLPFLHHSDVRRRGGGTTRVADLRFDRLDRFSYQRTELTFPHFNRYNDHDKYCLARSITYHKVCC